MRISLNHLFIFIVPAFAVAISFGVFCWNKHCESLAIAIIERNQGEVIYDKGEMWAADLSANNLDQQLAAIQRLPQLSGIAIRDARLSELQMKALGQHPHADQLSYVHCSFPASIPKNERIVGLLIRDMEDLEGANIEGVLNAYPNLDDVTLYRCKLSSSEMQALTQSSSLTHLELSHCDLSAGASDLFAKFGELKVLRITYSMLEWTQLAKALENLTRLEYIYLILPAADKADREVQSAIAIMAETTRMIISYDDNPARTYHGDITVEP